MYFKLLATAEKQVEIFSGDSYSRTKNLYV